MQFSAKKTARDPQQRDERKMWGDIISLGHQRGGANRFHTSRDFTPSPAVWFARTAFSCMRTSSSPFRFREVYG
jgi:hypothetical protein